jgi:hypothetical protein
MSGSAGLAAAKRRRAGPSAIVNDVPKRPSNLPPNLQNQQQSIQQPTVPLNISNTHPLVILAHHEQQISKLKTDLEDVRYNQENMSYTKQSPAVDEQSIQFFKSRYETMSQEIDEMKKLLIKIQTFSMETNLEILKMKRLLKNDTKVKDVEELETTGLEKLSLSETN